MASETIFQNWIFKDFAWPFLLIFFIVFAVLEKTTVLGKDKHQINALVAAVVAVIFVGALYPKQIVGNLVLFLSVALIVVFVFLLLYGFVSGNEKVEFGKGMKVFFMILSGIAVILALLWASGVTIDQLTNTLFKQDWSNSFWTNFIFVVVIAGALALILNQKK
jgi:hypothetical protein